MTKGGKVLYERASHAGVMRALLETLLQRNLDWAAERVAQDPRYFKRLAEIQRPYYLWIGCSDSRVPANVISGLEPGEVFVHRRSS